MLIGFVGDVHGRVFHALAALATWQAVTGKRFDLLVQVGDMGAYPEPARMDAATLRYLQADPAEADFSRLLRADGQRAEHLRRLREHFAGPIHFIRGNHEDFAWLQQLPVDVTTGTARVDPFDLLRYVPDGTTLRFDDLPIAFLGGEETDAADAGAIDPGAYRALMDRGAGTIDVLVTHDAPYGLSVGYHGQTQGSRLITRLVEHVEPRFHVAGHYHLNGPRAYGRTTFLCLSDLVASPLWHPESRGLQVGCLAVLDTETAALRPVMDPWLSDFDTPFDFDVWVDAFTSR